MFLIFEVLSWTAPKNTYPTRGNARHPWGESHSGTSAQGRSLLIACPKEVPRKPSHDRHLAVRSCSCLFATCRRRNADYSFIEPRHCDCGNPNKSVYSVWGLNSNWRPSNLQIARCETTGVSTSRPQYQQNFPGYSNMHLAVSFMHTEKSVTHSHCTDSTESPSNTSNTKTDHTVTSRDKHREQLKRSPLKALYFCCF
jgi:hypothetical protein